MSDSSPFQPSQNDGGHASRFTYRDLRLLGQSSVSSPLRVIALVDFDCFYAQCESVRLGLPEDQPLGVQQFLHVIATNYPARAAGLKKVVTAIEAKQKCPNIVLQHVPTWREGDTTWAYRDDIHDHMDTDKSSLDYYRLQSRKAIQIVKDTLSKTSPPKVEKAGIDEVFLDLSAQVHGVLLERYPELVLSAGVTLDSQLPRLHTQLLDWQGNKVVGTEEADEDTRVIDWDDIALHIGSEIVWDLRSEIHQRLGYTCSAGVARNKVVAKLAAGHNKPNGQRVIRNDCIETFLSPYKLTKLRGLGGKLGHKAVSKLKTESIEDLLNIPLKKMQLELGSESGSWIYRVIRGIEFSEVVSRTQIKSMASAKTFTPSIEGLEQAERWLRIFAADIMGRIDEQEGRRPRTIAVHHQINGRFGPTKSKQAPIPVGSRLDIQCLFKLSREILIDITREGPSWPCLLLSISVSDFFDIETTSHSLTSYWEPKIFNMQKDTDEKDSVAPLGRSDSDTKLRKRTILDYQTVPHVKNAVDTHQNPQQLEVSAGKRQRMAIMAKDKHFETPHVDVNEDMDGKYRCPTCKDLILDSEVLEHLDWHVAMDLQGQY